ncbi:MAG: efflux transporter outer membrane subunit [Desulfotignum sp.]|jgi:NodT family efflux transporter outer membrane factor (OMF) lipoprotein|nr:efflux transporter outer membrane subunit [Desulfotignum sp.]
MHCFLKTDTCVKTGFSPNAFTLIVCPAIILVLIIMSGCAAVGPEFQTPELPAPDTWHTEMAGGLAVSETVSQDNAAWWKLFKDPQLTRLIKHAAAGNLDLQKAVVRIQEARALYGISQAGDYPVLDSTGLIQRQQSSEETGTGTASGFFHAGFDAAWELDIFGKIRRSQQAALAEVETRQEALNAVLISLQAEVALNYLELRTFQERLVAARGNLEVQKETYEINLSRFNAGLIGELPVHQSQYILEQTRSQIPLLLDGLGRTANRLAVLVGKSPGSLHEALIENRAIPCIPLEVAMGIPARTLRQRPDIRRAERVLARETALVGVAMADLYPQFHLSGTFGLEALSVGNFFNSSSRFWGIGPRVSWRLFDGGRIRQAVAAQSARQEQAMIEYQAALLTAREEIENAILAFAKEQLRRDSLVKATAAARNADRIARDQYQAGLVDFSNVLDAQRSLLSFEDQLAQSRGTVSANLVRLYKALGGGWQHMAR